MIHMFTLLCIYDNPCAYMCTCSFVYRKQVETLLYIHVYVCVITDDALWCVFILVYCRRKRMLRWKNVEVGDVLRLEKDDFITVSVHFSMIMPGTSFLPQNGFHSPK